MSELKTRFVDDTYAEYYNTGKHELAQIYLKSEADEVIAEKDREIEVQKRLRNMALASVPNVLKVMKIIQHQKYKRCVAMYHYCAIKALYELDFKGNDVEWKWYSKWMHKWFKLAENFKPNNQTAQ